MKKPEIDTVEFLYDGRQDGFAAFVKALYSDYLLDTRVPDVKGTEDTGNRERENN
ncbi:MAG: hypothetical protein IKX06_03995 [Clostridia bacterium]|nr:hypothetical protein [Clostridia bacterium]